MAPTGPMVRMAIRLAAYVTIQAPLCLRRFWNMKILYISPEVILKVTGEILVLRAIPVKVLYPGLMLVQILQLRNLLLTVQSIDVPAIISIQHMTQLTGI